MIKHIENLRNSEVILGMDNIDMLIKAALNQSRKKLLNEEEFFNFLFSNGLGHLVKNRFKIDLYFPDKDNWYHI